MATTNCLVTVAALLLCVIWAMPDTAAVPQARQERKPSQALLPIDEAGKDPSLLAFRNRLRRAVERNDTKTVLSAVHPKIRLGFGGHDGAAAFAKNWRANQDGYRSELLRVLSHGGAWEKGEKGRKMFTAPYYYARFPDIVGEEGIHDWAAILGKNVNVRRAAGSKSPVVATLSYAIVGIVEYSPGIDLETSWLRIRMADGTEGCVLRKYVGSPLGYRAGFEKSNGKWQMTFFLAGD